jgi:spore coat protein SA
MKLLIIAPEQYPVPNLKGTSVENCIYNIAIRLAKHHDVTIVSRQSSNLPNITVIGNLKIIRVPFESNSKYIKAVINAIKNCKFDAIQIDNRPYYLASVKALFPKTPIFLFLHSLTFVTPPKAQTSNIRTQLRNATGIITNSHSTKKQLTLLYPLIADKVKVVHLGVNLQQFRPATSAERLIIRKKYNVNGSFAIVYVGRFITIKGIPNLIRATEIVRRQISTAELYLAGGGSKSYVKHIKRLAQKAKVPLHFIDYLARKDVHHAYWIADCFVCPTQAHESFGLVNVEALACGVPTVASRIGGIQEIIRHNRNGLLVTNYKSTQALAKEILKITNNKKLAKRLGAAGIRSCQKRFNWENTCSKLELIYSDP